MAESTHEYFFELLTEEIPAWMHAGMEASLRPRLVKLLEELGCAGDVSDQIRIFSTPRRIVFWFRKLPAGEADRTEEVKGPPRKSAYDAEGKPTQALLGFLKKNGAGPEAVIPGSDAYVRIRRQIKGRPTDARIQERVPQVVESIRWPKMMRWGKGEHTYIRPVHSVISLFDQQPLPIRIFGIASGTTTVGHRTLARDPIEVSSFGDYVEKLELGMVILDGERRRLVMAEKSRALAQQLRGVPADDESIWSQWQYLTEFPGVVRAEFRPEYLTLPEEVLVTVMRVHQKQLPIRNEAGKLTNSFLAVMDNVADSDGNAASGNAFVTNARFADAKFFYETDRRKPLGDRLEALSHLQFQEKLGDYRKKTERIEKIVASLCGALKCETADALRAARLCKTDLVTEMVKEFTDLQGKIGGIYAREEGERQEVWQAIYDHYLPVNVEDRLPRTLSGALVSLADKIDTLYGFFAVGQKPTGSKDPFGLRRAAQGVVQILLSGDPWEVPLGIEQLVGFAAAAYGQPTSGPVVAELLAFFEERVRTLLETDAYALAYDEVAAAMAAGWTQSLPDLLERAKALHLARGNPRFLSILDSARRIANITADQPVSRVDESLFEVDAERRLSEIGTLLTQQIDELISGRHYERALESFAGMASELEAFFKEVMVMVDDPAVRANRTALLRKVGGAVRRIGDVTKIVVDRRGYAPKSQ